MKRLKTLSQWAEHHLPAPRYLGLLLVLLYFAIYKPSLLTGGLLLLALGFFIWHWPRRQWLTAVSLLLVFAALFFWRQYQATRLAADRRVPSQLTVIPDTVVVNGDSLSFRAKSGQQTYQAFYSLTTEEEKAWFKANSQTLQLQVQATLETPQAQRNFQGFDYQAYLKTQGIYAILQIESIENSQAVRPGLLGILRQWRRAAIVHIQTHFPAPMQHYMTGLLFGYLDKDFDEMSSVYTSLGIIHLFALSGMQVGFFLGCYRFVYLRLGGYKDWLFWAQLPFALIYGVLTGGSVSVSRSLVQSQLAFLGFRRWDNLAVTIAVLVLIQPNSLLSAGGILSLSYAFLLSSFDWERYTGWRKMLLEMAVISLGALPVLLYYYGTFQPLSIPLTAVFSIIFDYLMLPGLSLIFVLSLIFPITQVNGLFQVLEWVISSLGQVISRPLVLGKPSLFMALALLASLAGLADYWRQKKKRLALMLLASFLLLAVKHPLTNEVTIVDVGQGDAILLRDMWGKTILIDTGGRVTFGQKEAWKERISSSNAERTLIPYLQARGIGKIDQLVLTHTDTDHVGDLEVLAEHIAIGQILVSPGSLTKASFLTRLQALKLPVNTLSAGQTLTIMGSQLQCLYPSQTGDGGNNDSIVLYGRLLDKTFLFTGDLEAEGEADLLAAYPGLQTDILKTGHHGSKGSSSPVFLDAIAPSVALISAGQNNRYKHPHDETLTRLEERSIAILRTDQQGAIRFSGWQTWQVQTVR